MQCAVVCASIDIHPNQCPPPSRTTFRQADHSDSAMRAHVHAVLLLTTSP